MTDGIYKLNFSTPPYFDFKWLVATTGANKLEVADLSTNLSIGDEDDYKDRGSQHLIDYFDKVFEIHSPDIVFLLSNRTRSDNNGQTLEYQMISDRKIPKR